MRTLEMLFVFDLPGEWSNCFAFNNTFEAYPEVETSYFSKIAAVPPFPGATVKLVTCSLILELKQGGHLA